jgi:hypothetical protein
MTSRKHLCQQESSPFLAATSLLKTRSEASLRVPEFAAAIRRCGWQRVVLVRY